MAFGSRYADPVIPDQDLAAFVLARAAEHPDRPAVVEAPSGRTLTYGELSERVDRFAGGLAGLGVGKGDVVAIMLPNGAAFAVAFLGCARAGAVSTTLNPAYTGHEVATQVADAGARVLIASAECAAKAVSAIDSGVQPVVARAGSGGAMWLDDAFDAGGAPPQVELDPAVDLVTLPYSSGTTGLPKGVMLTHRNLVANAVQCDAFYTAGHDIVLAVAPFFHIMGMAAVLTSGLHRGATLVTMARFDFEQGLQAIEEHRVTCAIVAPPVVVALAKHPLVEHHDLSSLRLLASGGAPLGADVQRACGDRLGCRTVQGWGMTELAGAGSVSPPPGQGPDRPGTVGWCVAGAEMRITDLASGDEVGVGEVGELSFRGPNVMRGYLHNPAATTATLTEDGWCRTGDVGHVDADGFVHIVDRLKEMIKYKGYQVAPAELEAVLLTHPGVSDAAVVASPDDDAGEVPKAFVVLEPAADPDAVIEHVAAYVAERVAPYKRVRRYEALDAIPRTPSGKVIRRGLIERERLARQALASPG